MDELVVFYRIPLKTGLLSSKHYGRRYMEDDASIHMFKSMFLPSLLIGQCYLRELEMSPLFMINL